MGRQREAAWGSLLGDLGKGSVPVQSPKCTCADKGRFVCKHSPIGQVHPCLKKAKKVFRTNTISTVSALARTAGRRGAWPTLAGDASVTNVVYGAPQGPLCGSLHLPRTPRYGRDVGLRE